ncbi:MAG: NADH-quinone oxidoreductase subunit N [Candidatus Sumerlaeia bacterium]|nr:NADH-quinone oxidoreductase subunit N [Candidatus Sumerlaeia bacterium]
MAGQPYIPVIIIEQLAPLLILLAGALGCLVADAASNKAGSRRVLPFIAGAALLAALATFFLPLWPANRPFLEGFLRVDRFGVLGSVTILFAMFVMTVLGPETVRRRNLPSGEYYALILFAALGMVTLSLANELVTAFIAIEILSLSLYVLTGIDRRSARSTEGAFKYFVLGAFASAFFVMGMAFLYGATGSTRLNDMAEVFRTGARPLLDGSTSPLNAVFAFMGFTLLFVGISFKLSLAPFHMWAPDVYQGAPTTTTMAIATASKIGVFALLFHVIVTLASWPPFYNAAAFLLTAVAAASIVWGNVQALAQTNVKRMLAFSSIAHGGYVMVAYVALMSLPTASLEALSFQQQEIAESILLYLFGYTLMNVLAFGLAHHLGKGGEGEMKNYRGLWKRSPMAASGMALALFSLTGIPPTVGFIGKFYVFRHAIEQGQYGLAVIGVLASVISAFYYLRLVVTMFMTDEEAGADAAQLAGGGDSAAVLAPGTLALGVAAGMLLLFGVFPMIFFVLVRY